MQKTLAALAAAWLALSAAAAPARADDDCLSCLSANGYGWEITLCDTLPRCGPGAGKECQARVQRHYERQARLLARAAAIDHMVSADTLLHALLTDAIIHLDTSPDDSVTQLLYTRYFRHTPATVSRFQQLWPAPVAPLFTVALGSYPNQKKAEAKAKTLVELCAGWRAIAGDSSFPRWKLTDCSGLVGWHADLFILPPGPASGRAWTVLSGLYLNSSMADLAVGRLRRRHGLTGRALPIRVDARVLRAAREWADRLAPPPER